MRRGLPMRVELAYGTDGLAIEVPDSARIVSPQHSPALPDAMAALTHALRHPVASPPLRQLASPGKRVAISVCDITRAQPREPVLTAILAELDGVVAPEDVAILVATGTHRSNTPEELRAMLGDEIARTCRVLNHDSRDDASLTDLGTLGEGVPVRLANEWVEADLRLTTGFVEPHFFAGFSGGPKMIAPGLAGLDTVLVLHDALRIGDARSTWGVIEGNPIQRDIREIARHPLARAHFSLDVLLNRDQRITRVFAGELFAMHAAACAAAKVAAMSPLDHPYDVVVTTNSGYPLDQNLYQAVKGMSAAAQVVSDGGTILCAAECRDGLPAHGRYADTLRGGASPEALLAEITERPVAIPDQWQVQVQALIQRRARVGVKSLLSEAEVRAAHFDPVDGLSAAIASAMSSVGADATLCVLPEGPQTIPYVAR
ncbi:MAG: nickel-dependent lactate racemase [Acidobacteriota bacterium]|nr:nickel-dependent lactate racemase [Acidobacteriota bacterium]